jgi:hypothetical protein
MDYFIPGAISCGGKVVAPVNCRVIDQNIYATPLFNQLPGNALHSQTICNRYFERESPPSVRLDLCANPFREIVTRPVVKRHISAFPGKDFADCGPNPTGSAGYKSSLSFQQ